MKKVLLFTVLLLTLAVVVTTPIAAKKGGPPGPPGVEKDVEFTSDISSGGATVTMIFRKNGGNIRFYNKYAPEKLYFSGKFKDESAEQAYDFSGWQDYCWNIVIDVKDNDGEPGEAATWIDFGELGLVDVVCDRSIAPYQLRGFGNFDFADGTYTITLTDTKIYDVKYVPSRSKGCKGAWGKEYINPQPLTKNIIFDMTIQVVSP